MPFFDLPTLVPSAVHCSISEIHRRWEAGALENPAGSPYTNASAVDRLIAIADSLNPA
ncbi:MAG: hypothetical protein NCA08_11165 [Deltaproteobacteria bacterium]|nr:hypothetical protein [Candidatus Deferrimicrobium borealis]